MFFSLFAKECRQILKSIVFYVYIVVLVLFYITQLGDFSTLSKPQPGQESYGTKPSSDPQKIMDTTLGKLVMEAYDGNYTTYPVGFYKKVRLNEKDQAEVERIIEKVSGREWKDIKEEIERFYDEMSTQNAPIMAGIDTPEVHPAKDLTYQEFLPMMERVNTILGGGSSYSADSVPGNAFDEMTYEEAQKEYEAVLSKDGVIGAYARLFCDYICLMAGILPVFLAVARSMKDRKAKTAEVIYARRTSSAGVILSRYLANVVMGMLPIALLGLSMHLQCLFYGSSLGVPLDNLAFVKYILGWIFPSFLTALSVGFLVTEMTGGPLAVLVQGLWWWVSTMTGSMSLVGGFGLELSPRWNTCGKTEVFFEQLSGLVVNRAFYLGLSAVLLAGTILVYELKRRGVWHFHGSIRRNRKSKSEA